MNRQILEQIVFQFDVLAGIVADLDQEDPSIINAAMEMAAKLIDTEMPKELAADSKKCATLIKSIFKGKGNPDNNYRNLCELLDLMRKKADALISIEHETEFQEQKDAEIAQAAADNAAVVDNVVAETPVDVEPASGGGDLDELLKDIAGFTLEPAVGAELSLGDSEEMCTQLDVIDELVPELAKGSAHVYGVVSDLFVKIEKLETITAEVRSMAYEAAQAAKQAADGDLEQARAEIIIKNAARQLRKDLQAASDEQSSLTEDMVVKSGRDILSGSFLDQTLVLLENLESDMLSLEGGSSEAMSRILVIIRELRTRSESLGFDAVANFLGDVRSFLKGVNVGANRQAFNLLLEAKDLLSDFYNTVSDGGDTELDGVRAEMILAAMGELVATEEVGPAEVVVEAAVAEDEGSPPPDVHVDINNPEMVDFVTESKEYLRSAEVALIGLEKDPGNREFINEIFRCFHNIKGISGFLNLPDVQGLSHTAESLMDLAREGKIEFEGPVAIAAFDALDMLREMVGRVGAALAGETYKTPGGYSALIVRLKDPSAAAKRAKPAASKPAVSSAQKGAAPSAAATSAAQQGQAASRTKTTSDGSIKVNTTRLDSLIDAVGELVIANAMVVQEPEIAGTSSPRLARNVSLLGKITRELQELAMSMRMVTLKNTFHKMSRVARDLSVKSSVPVEFTFSGEDTELDRNVVEEIGSPLVHMVRNAIDHGLESPEERVRLGKPEKGNVHLAAYHEGGSVVIRVQDDGKGLNREVILAKAKKMGLVSEDAEMTDREIFQLIFHPGFSTAKEVTDISGRGVGMDVVRRSIENLRGRVDIDSVVGRGTTFIIRMPLTMAIIDGMVVVVGKNRYIIPTIAIVESLQPQEAQLNSVVGRGEMISIRGQLLPMFRLYKLFEIEGAIDNPCEALCVVVGGNGESCALMVDNLIGQQQVVIKSLGRAFDRIDGVSGGAIMGDGRVALILDTAGLVRLAHGV